MKAERMMQIQLFSEADLCFFLQTIHTCTKWQFQVICFYKTSRSITLLFCNNGVFFSAQQIIIGI